jgi:hypothetical protein
VDLVLPGPLTRDRIVDLCACARGLLVGCDAPVVVLDIENIAAPNADTVDTVDTLARLQLTIGRMGKRIRYRNACGEVRELMVLMGLSDVLWLEPPSRFEPIGEPEEWEQALGVEEERDA